MGTYTKSDKQKLKKVRNSDCFGVNCVKSKMATSRAKKVIFWPIVAVLGL